MPINQRKLQEALCINSYAISFEPLTCFSVGPSLTKTRPASSQCLTDRISGPLTSTQRHGGVSFPLSAFL